MYAGLWFTVRYDWQWFGYRPGVATVVVSAPGGVIDPRALASAVVAAIPRCPNTDEIAKAVVGKMPAVASPAPPAAVPAITTPDCVRPAPVRVCPDPEIVRTDPSELAVCGEVWEEREAEARSAVRFLNAVRRVYRRR